MSEDLSLTAFARYRVSPVSTIGSEGNASEVGLCKRAVRPIGR